MAVEEHNFVNNALDFESSGCVLDKEESISTISVLSSKIEISPIDLPTSELEIPHSNGDELISPLPPEEICESSDPELKVLLPLAPMDWVEVEYTFNLRIYKLSFEKCIIDIEVCNTQPIKCIEKHIAKFSPHFTVIFGEPYFKNINKNTNQPRIITWMEIITSLPFNEYDDPIPNLPDQKLQTYILLYNEEIEEPIENATTVDGGGSFNQGNQLQQQTKRKKVQKRLFLDANKTFEEVFDIFATCEPNHPVAGIHISNEKSNIL